MSTSVYYFSATGNSLVVGRDIARFLDGKLTPIASTLDRSSIDPETETIGIVFPVYYAEISGIPQIVRKFVQRLVKIEAKYIFAVCVHDGKPGRTLTNLSRLISSRRGTLAAGFLVKIGISEPISEKIKLLFSHEKIRPNHATEAQNKQWQALGKKWKETLPVIRACVNARNKGRIDARGTLLDKLFAPLLPVLQRMHIARLKELSKAPHLPFNELVHWADRIFYTDDTCNGCGICAQVCPVKNIELVEKMPS